MVDFSASDLRDARERSYFFRYPAEIPGYGRFYSADRRFPCSIAVPGRQNPSYNRWDAENLSVEFDINDSHVMVGFRDLKELAESEPLARDVLRGEADVIEYEKWSMRQVAAVAGWGRLRVNCNAVRIPGFTAHHLISSSGYQHIFFFDRIHGIIWKIAVQGRLDQAALKQIASSFRLLPDEYFDKLAELSASGSSADRRSATETVSRQDAAIRTTTGPRTVTRTAPPGPRQSGSCAPVFFGAIAVLAVVGIIVGVLVAIHHGSGYPSSATLADSQDPAGNRSVKAIVFSPDGRQLATADSYSGINLWNASNNTQIAVLADRLYIDSFSANAVAFSPDSRTVAAGEYHGHAFLWNTASKRERGVLTTKVNDDTGGVYSLAFSPNGRLLAAGDYDGTVYLWNMPGGSLAATLPVPANGTLVGSLAFSPDGRLLAVGSDKGATYLWDVSRRTRIAILPAVQGTQGIGGVAFSPDGRTLATLDTSGTTILWNVSARRQAGALPTPDKYYQCSIAFSPDGKTLAAGCSGASTYLWDVATRRQSATLTGSSGSGVIDGVAYSPDGKTLAAGTDAGYIYLWDLQNLGKASQ